MQFVSSKFSLVLAILFAAVTLSAIADDSSVKDKSDSKSEKYTPKSKAELKKILTPIQYAVTQEEGTERAFSNKYWNNKRIGVYRCIVCDRELFSSKTKYRSGTGWPSFYKPIGKESVGLKADNGLFYTRTEVHCSRCNAHLGHVFDDGPQPTGKRYCMNSASLKFIEQPKAKDKDSSSK